MTKLNLRNSIRSILYASGGIALTLGATAQQAETNTVEEIVVYGVRASLENALNVKREANSIVDAISSSDIDAFPALDLGEALQAIPGVQLDRVAEGRRSQISLRGLSGNYVKTTAFGQSFAAPSKDRGPVGTANPFSAFEAGVFDGVTVIKTPTAEHQVGGIAGTVDMQLAEALSKEDGTYSLSVGGRYEELTEVWDPKFNFSASKHLIEDVLAVTFKGAYSDQTFRRDTANYTSFTDLGENPLTMRVNSNTIGDYRTTYGIPDDAVVQAVSAARNITEFSDGDRLSFTSNIEWQATDQLKLGAHVLYTKRDLDQGTKQDVQFGAPSGGSRPQNADVNYFVEPDINTAPFVFEQTDDGRDIYLVTRNNIIDGDYQFTNRKTTFFQQTQGIFLYGEYTTDNWVVDGVVTSSKARNRWQQLGMTMRVEGHNADTFMLDGVEYPTQPTGIDILLDSGQGNIKNAEVVATGFDRFDWGVDWPYQASQNSNTYRTADPANDGVRLAANINGRAERPTRWTQSAEINAERELDFGFGDPFRLTSVKFGARMALEELQNYDGIFGIGGTNPDAINNDTIKDDLVSSRGASFFNGHYPGAVGVGTGWQTVDNEEFLADLKNPLMDIPGATISYPSGLYERQRGPHSLAYANNYDVDQNITSLYAMTNFGGQLGPVPYAGNIGLRYVHTDNTFNGVKRDQLNGDVLVPQELKDDYDHLLPSMNVSFDLMEDLILRTAYSETFVRPNIRAQTPTTDVEVRHNNNLITVNKPGSYTDPYDATNFDISLEWYNRDGSAVSIGFFKKELTNFFGREDVCVSGDPVVLDAFAGGDVVRSENPAAPDGYDCLANFETTDDDGNVGIYDVRVREWQNSTDTTIVLDGIEVALQQKLDFLPYPWDGFGGVFNYTHISQSLRGDKDDDNAKLYNVSPNSYNLIGYYENDGFSIRLSYNWRNQATLQGTNSYVGETDHFASSTGRLDLSSSYAVTDDFSVYFKAFNLTDELRKEFWGFDERAVSRVDYQGRIMELSVSYKF